MAQGDDAGLGSAAQHAVRTASSPPCGSHAKTAHSLLVCASSLVSCTPFLEPGRWGSGRCRLAISAAPPVGAARRSRRCYRRCPQSVSAEIACADL